MKAKHLGILLNVLWIIPVAGSAQVTADANGRVVESNANSNKLTMTNFTVPAGNDALLVVATRNAEKVATSMTYNGSALIKLDGILNGTSSSSIWYLHLGNLASPITSNIVVTLSGVTQTRMIAAISFKNVSSVDPISGYSGNTFTSAESSSSLVNTGSSGDMIYDVISSIGNISTPPAFTIGAGQSLVGTGISTSHPKRRISASYKSLTGTSTNMSWTISGNIEGLGIHLSARIKAASFLPVELNAFRGSIANKEVTLKWITASESDNAGFIVQRSPDGAMWKDLAYIAGAGTTQQEITYEYKDSDPLAGNNYYRLAQTDHDGAVEFSPLLVVENNIPAIEVNIFPNPSSNGRFNLSLDNSEEAIWLLIVYDRTGKIIDRRTVQSSSTKSLEIPVELKNIESGVYFVRLTTGTVSYQGKLMIE